MKTKIELRNLEHLLHKIKIKQNKSKVSINILTFIRFYSNIYQISFTTHEFTYAIKKKRKKTVIVSNKNNKFTPLANFTNIGTRVNLVNHIYHQLTVVIYFNPSHVNSWLCPWSLSSSAVWRRSQLACISSLRDLSNFRCQTIQGDQPWNRSEFGNV